MLMNNWAMRVLMCGCLCAAQVWAQEQNAATPEEAPSQEAVVPIPAPAEPVAATETPSVDGLVTLAFQEADLKNVLKILAVKGDVNIVAGPEVVGAVTIELKNVPWAKALDVILSTYGYGYEREGNIITVLTMDNLKKRREARQALNDQEPPVTRTFILNYAKAGEVADSVSKMKTPKGSVNFDQRTNALIVRDIASNVDLIGKVIKTLDAVTPQVLIEAKVVETTLSNSEKLGVDWILQAAASGAARPTTFPFTDRSSNNFFPDAFPPNTTITSKDAVGFTYGMLDASKLQAVFEILNTRSDTNILSSPRVVTLDNQPAKIIVGTQYPIPQYTYNQEQAKLQVSGWDYKDIGIILEVTPHVNSAGFVTVDLQPKITAIIDKVTVENTELPQLSTEETKTKVMIENGKTLVIAGLIKDQVTVSEKKVPFLGDIPFVGKAFQKKERTKTKSELMIFLTPHILDGNNNPSPVPAEPAAK